MPVLAGNIEEIQNSLKASFGRGRDTLDQNVVAASKGVLLQSIEFKPASTPYSLQCNALKTKYTPLNPSSTPNKSAGSNGAAHQQQHKSDDKGTSRAGMEAGEESLPRPKIILYPDELVKMEWSMRTSSRIGAGLVNMGNTCFFNSTLQCLTYTAPLVNYCLTPDHRQKCKKKDFCMMCEIQAHIRTSLDCGGRSIKPHSMLQKLRCIARHMKWGRQEDAHEFLRFVVDHLQQSCLNGEAKIDKLSKETTVINQIFGGYLRSQVTCLCCQAKSNTFDPFMDLSLDIKGVNTVEDALYKFVKPETLDNENAYKCPKCRNKVRAHKRFSIQKPPNVLTLQLNRFDFSRHMSGKINRFIRYPERINIRDFMSQRQGEPVVYHLYGVLVHSGHSSDCGHYYSYVKSPSKTWYCMNDSIVHQANHQSVFSADAYVLFYARVNRSNSTSSTTNSSSSKSTVVPSKNSFIGPVLPNHMKSGNKSSLTNGIHGKTSNELGMPLPRQQDKQSTSMNPSPSKIVRHASSLPDAHKKISFPILTPQQKKLQQQQLEDDDGKRIVLQIKHGNSTTMEKSPDGKSKVVNGTISTLPFSQTQKTGLVPYVDDDSDSEQENKSVSSLSSASKLVNSSSCIAKKINSVQGFGDSLSCKSSVSEISVPVTNGGGDAKRSTTKNQHSEKPYSTSSKTLFVWEDSPSPIKPVSVQKPSPLKDSEDRRGLSPSSKVSSNGLHHKFQPDTNISKGRQKLTPSPSPSPSPSSSTSLSKTFGKTNLALDLPAASSSKLKTSSSGTWYIHPQDGAPSPRGSCSSTNSINSTSEWSVEAKANTIQSKDSAKIVSQPLPVNGSNNNVNKGKFLTTSNIKSFSKDKTLPNSADSPTPCMTRPTEAKSSRQESCDGSRTPVNISDKKSLLDASSSQSSESSSKKLSKFKSKPKLACNSLEASSSPPSDSSTKKSLKKKKKKKKHKKEKEDKKRLLTDGSDSDSDEGTISYKKMKTKEEKRSRECASVDNSSSSEEGYEWVERTIESPANKAKVNHAFVQSWNHHIKDDLSKRDGEDELKCKKTKTWDGARQSKLDKELKVNNRDYKSQVLSWDGGKSQLTKDLEEDREMNRKRQQSDRYDEELDAGKVKKVKSHKEETDYGSLYNPFQDYYHYTKKSSKDESETSWSQDHSYYHRRDHNHCKNNHSRHDGWHDRSYHKYNNGRSKVGGSR